jgi:hypothetical protein
MTTAAKPRPLRLNQRAELVPTEQYARWHEIASATAGLTELDRQVLDAVARYYAMLQERGDAPPLTLGGMALCAGVRPFDISATIWGLIGRSLLAVLPGAGHRPHEYLPALPKRIAATLAPVAEDAPPL